MVVEYMDLRDDIYDDDDTCVCGDDVCGDDVCDGVYGPSLILL